MPQLEIQSEELRKMYKIENNTAIFSSLSDAESCIETEIGDIKQTEFYPQIKFKKWNNECNFSLRATDNLNASLLVENNKIRWSDNDKEVVFYTKSKPIGATDSIILKSPRYKILEVTSYAESASFMELLRNSVYDGFRMLIIKPKNDFILFVGTQSPEKYIYLDKLPTEMIKSRLFYSNSHGPIFYDPGVIDLVFTSKNMDLEFIMNLMLRAFKNIGIDAQRSTHRPISNDIVLVSNGIEKKICGISVENDIGTSMINVGSDISKWNKYYKNEISDKICSINDVYPKITSDSIINSILLEFSKILNGIPVEDTYSTEEKIILSEYLSANNDENWINNGVLDKFSNYISSKNIDTWEMDIILKIPPPSNIISLTMQTKNVVFYKQYRPTNIEIENGVFMPPDVINSYAVYHLSKKNNSYKTGKIGHIFRPKITDANENWTWGDLLIEENILSIIIPESFLENAIYPIYIDPTFGYTTNGVSVIGTLNIFYSHPVSTIESGQMVSFHAYVQGHALGQSKACFGIYSSGNSLPIFISGELVDYITPVTIAQSQAAGWVSGVATNEAILYIGSYFIFWTGSGVSAKSSIWPSVYYDTIPINFFQQNLTFTDIPPNLMGSVPEIPAYNQLLSIYGSYVVGGPPPSYIPAPFMQTSKFWNPL